MIRALLIVVGLALALPAVAQTVQVRSGRHADFTRLIVDLPRRVEFEIDNGDDRAIVRFDAPDMTFDTTRIFRRIPRDVVSEVTADSTAQTLTVVFGCRCEVASFWHGKSLLVLDVRERTGMTADREPQAEPAPITSSPTPKPTRRARSVPPGTGSLAASLASTRLAASLAPRSGPHEDPAEPAKPAAPSTEENREAALIAEARQRLVEQLGRAAAQGLLDPRHSLTPAQASPDQEAPASEPQEEDPAPHDAGAHVNLKAQSSIDRDFLAQMGRRTGAGAAPTCLTESTVDLAAWGTDEPFADQIGPVRARMMGEFDALDPASAIQLARLYLYFGFGIEARQTLSLLSVPPPERDMLHDLAEIMETGQATGRTLTGQSGCDGPAALWSVLSYPSLPADTKVNEDAVLLAFSALPAHLRAHLGPVLTRRFLDAGHRDAADKVLRILDRSDETRTIDAELAEADLDQAEGAPEQAVEKMENVAESNAAVSAEALIKLIDTQRDAGEPVSYEHAILAGAYAQQNRGGALEGKLNRAYLIALSASGAFAQAHEELDRLAPQITPEQTIALKSDMLDQLTAHADEMTFLRYAVLGYRGDHRNIAADVANKAAERLLSAGFAAQAQPFVEHGATGRTMRERQLLRARIALAQGLPRQAEVHLMGLDGEDADLLRADARSASADHLAAAELYRAAGAAEQAEREAWLAEDWQELEQAGTKSAIDAAALASLTGAEDQTDEAAATGLEAERALARNRALVQQSLATRDTIGGLLEATQSPELDAP